MSYSAPARRQHWHSIDTVTGSPLRSLTSQSGSGTWYSANGAIYVPVYVRHTVVVKQLWFGNAATATGNYDIGLYDAAGVRLVSAGSTAKPSSTEEVVVDCTDTTIGPGLYYVALACSNATDTFSGVGWTAPVPAAFGVRVEASAFPLPATATFAAADTITRVPAMGMFLDTRVT